MYNPLRPHIVEFACGKFAVRKFVLPWGWHYYDNQRYGPDHYWWMGKSRPEWWLIPSLERAQQVLAGILNPPLKVTKVYHAGKDH